MSWTKPRVVELLIRVEVAGAATPLEQARLAYELLTRQRQEGA